MRENFVSLSLLPALWLEELKQRWRKAQLLTPHSVGTTNFILTCLGEWKKQYFVLTTQIQHHQTQEKGP